jgi:hypothetical protein
MLTSPKRWSCPTYHHLWTLLVFLVFLIASSSVVTAGSIRPYTMPQNLLQYFQAKYTQVDDSLESSVLETSDGPLGQITITGTIVMSVDVSGMTPEEAARAIAMAFLNEEADFLDIPSPAADLLESSLTVTEDGITVIQYARYMGNLPFVDEYFRVDVNEDPAITRVEARLAPVSAAMMAAVGQTTLSSDDVKTIVHNDLVRSNQPVEPTLSEPFLGATWRPPFVIWGARGSVGEQPAWGYRIDAFTGEILNKACTVTTMRENTGGTACD